jgi:hypothetical protein
MVERWRVGILGFLNFGDERGFTVRTNESGSTAAGRDGNEPRIYTDIHGWWKWREELCFEEYLIVVALKKTVMEIAG